MYNCTIGPPWASWLGPPLDGRVRAEPKATADVGELDSELPGGLRPHAKEPHLALRGLLPWRGDGGATTRWWVSDGGAATQRRDGGCQRRGGDVVVVVGSRCRCTKVGALLLTPLLVHGQSEPRPRPHLAGRWREARAQDSQGHAKTRNTKEQRGRSGLPRQDPCRGAVLASLARHLPWPLASHLWSESPLSPLPPRGKDSGDIPVVACRSL